MTDVLWFLFFLVGVPGIIYFLVTFVFYTLATILGVADSR